MAILTSLRRAFTVSYLLVAAFPVLLFGLVCIQLVAEHQLTDVQERNMLNTQSIAEEVDAFLKEVHADLMHVKQVVSADTILQSGSMDQFLGSVVANSQFFESIYYLNENRNVLHLGLMAQLETRRNDYLDLDFSGHQLFQKDFSRRMSAWSNTFVSLVTGEPSVTLGIPTKSGFLLGNIRLRSLEPLLQRYSTSGDVDVAIIDHNGTLIAHSISEKAMQRINFGNHPVVIKAMEGTDSTSEFRQGSTYLLESAVDIETAQWVIWVGLDMNLVNAPIENLRYLLIGFMIVTAIIASLIALFNVRRLMLPLTALGERTGLIADGRYDFQFPPSGFTEIDALANQISSMTHAIKVREESIITNEQRFRDLVNSIEGIVWEMDYPSFRYLFVSQQAESILGYPIQDWYEDPAFWSNKTHVDDLEQARAYSRLMAEKQEDYDLEYRMIAADGRIVWIRNLVTVVVEHDRPARLIGVMIDATEQKLLVDELARSEENYREIFNASSDAIFIHDGNTGKVIDVNQSMLSMFNCTYEDALEGGLEKISQGESPYAIKDAHSKIQEAKAKGYCKFEWMARRHTGELFWTEVSLRSATIGKQPRILAGVRDISSRKEADQQLQELNDRLTLLIDRMPIGCVYWTPAFTVNLWNPMAEKIFGFSEGEIVGKEPYGTIVPEEIKPGIKEIWKRLLAGDQTAHSVNENLTKSGQIITCEWFNTPVKNSDGLCIGVISMVQDISKRKAAEDELARYRENLEELVKERTIQLEEAQASLMQKERLAVLGQLTATVSHEIRNPLGTVANALYLLKESLYGKEFTHLQRPLKLAERNVERCDNIISDLLDFSRQRKVIKQPVDVDRWLRELFSEIVIPQDVYLYTDLAADCTINVDKERLRRVMVNVITNAFQAFDETGQPEKSLHVRTRVHDRHCELVFEDNGQGMSTEVMERIYEPLFSTKNFGVGLGVPIIKSIIENHGGHVEYQSEEGKGTKVTIRLPIEG